ncbi:hypothetical protein [Qipengyuania zhejiangensis]|uniref:hypothetical protein n=1 Tax=Qipengyuania zhejiangensis TaxID=3077782 RepID=UPI002D7A043A|nr:hypothetical protein [Qipengyuania sp. Z2]
MSMFGILLLAQAAALPAAPAPAAPTPVDEQIAAIGERMSAWQGGLAKVDAKLTCETKQSTGDGMIDAIRCGSMLMCVGPLAPQIDEIMALDIAQREKQEQTSGLMQTAMPCMEDYHRQAIARLAATRAGN